MVQIKFKFELKFKNVLSSVRTLVQLEKVQFSSSSERESAKLGTSVSDDNYESMLLTKGNFEAYDVKSKKWQQVLKL